MTPAEQAARNRALHVRSRLGQLWGEQLPPGGDPVLLVLTDAVLIDDEAGSAVGLVVQSDGVTVDVLSALVGDGGDAQARLALLPVDLRTRLEAVRHRQEF